MTLRGSLDLYADPPWDRLTLRALGRALVDDTTPPAHCPTYDEVMFWHHDLAAEVAAVVSTHNWESFDVNKFDMAARPKTIDTLLQKLRRPKPKLRLDDVQDLAGVRVDADMVLSQQTALANEIAEFFGGTGTTVRDLRNKPHSGYRAVHVWLRLPAGRVEIQIRTTSQSVWANTYEALGDKFGRGLRYDEAHEDPSVQQMAETLHQGSEMLANVEVLRQSSLDQTRRLEDLEKSPHADSAELAEIRRSIEDREVKLTTLQTGFLETLRKTKRTIERMEAEN